MQKKYSLSILATAFSLFFISVSLALAADSGTITNPLGDVTICKLLTSILNAALVLGAPIAVLFVVIAGAKFVFAMGKPDDLKKAKTNLLWTLIGIAIFFGAIVITQAIFQTIKPLLQQNNQNIASC